MYKKVKQLFSTSKYFNFLNLILVYHCYNKFIKYIIDIVFLWRRLNVFYNNLFPVDFRYHLAEKKAHKRNFHWIIMIFL